MKYLKKAVISLIVVLAVLTGVIGNSTTARAAVKLNKKTITIEKGKLYSLNLTGTKGKVTWSSNKKAVATVNKKGVVTGVTAGTANITAKAGEKSYTCKVTVRDILKESVKIVSETMTADGLLVEAQNISKKTINNVRSEVTYNDINGDEVSKCQEVIEGIASGDTFYMTFESPSEEFDSYKISYKMNTTSLTFTSRVKDIVLSDTWFDLTSNFFKSGATGYNSNSSRILTFDVVAIYTFKDKVVGFNKSVLNRTEPLDLREISVKGSKAAEYDAVTLIVNECATYN